MLAAVLVAVAFFVRLLLPAVQQEVPLADFVYLWPPVAVLV